MHRTLPLKTVITPTPRYQEINLSTHIKYAGGGWITWITVHCHSSECCKFSSQMYFWRSWAQRWNWVWQRRGNRGLQKAYTYKCESMCKLKDNDRDVRTWWVLRMWNAKKREQVWWAVFYPWSSAPNAKFVWAYSFILATGLSFTMFAWVVEASCVSLFLSQKQRKWPIKITISHHSFLFFVFVFVFTSWPSPPSLF